MGEPTDRFKKFLVTIGHERHVLLSSAVSFNPGGNYEYRYAGVTAEDLREYRKLGSGAVKDGAKEICPMCFDIKSGRVCVCER